MKFPVLFEGTCAACLHLQYRSRAGVVRLRCMKFYENLSGAEAEQRVTCTLGRPVKGFWDTLETEEG